MKLTTCAGVLVDVDTDVILRAAGAIYAHRRKTHGHPPLRAFRCRWCDGEIRGRGPLELHERDCTSRPSGELAQFTEADMRAMQWSPDDAA